MVASVLTTFPDEGMVQCDWIGPLANAETGNAAQAGRWPTKSVQAVGTFGAAGSVAIEGSNDGTNWFALDDSLGVVIALTAATPISDILQNTKHIRARVTAGDGTTALRVILVGV